MRNAILSIGSMRDNPKHMNPVVLKTGIPLVLSLSGCFFFSSFMVIRKLTRNRVPTETSMAQNQTKAPHIVIHQKSYSESIDSTTTLACEEEEEDFLAQTQVSEPIENLQFRQIGFPPELEQEIMSLKCQVTALQSREGELEEYFLRYCRSQEHESALKELRNALQFEIAQVDVLGLKVEIMDAENRRLDSVLAEYPRVIEELGSARLQMKSLQKKMKKLLRMKREGLRVLRRQALVLRKREAEISSRNEELKQRKRDIEELEAAVLELRRREDQLQMEKNELMEKLELAENLQSSTPQVIAEDSNQQGLDCEDLLTQIAQLQNDRDADIDELIYLRWINACLKYEFMRNQEQRHKESEGRQSFLEFLENDDAENYEMPYGSDNQEQVHEDNEKEKQPIHEFKNCEVECGSDNLLARTEHAETSLDAETTTKASAQSKPILFGKLKRWAKGKEKRKRSCDEKENQDKSSGRCSVSDMAIEHFTVRKSWSSVKPCFWVENAI